MICEVKDNGNEIVLKNITIADILDVEHQIKKGGEE